MNTTDTVNNGDMREYRDNLGRFRAGNSGRKPGTTSKLRQKVRDFVETNIENLQSYFDELDTKDKVKVLSDLLPFCISKLQSVSASDSEGNDLPEEQRAFDLSKLSESTLHEVLAVQKKAFEEMYGNQS